MVTRIVLLAAAAAALLLNNADAARMLLDRRNLQVDDDGLVDVLIRYNNEDGRKKVEETCGNGQGGCNGVSQNSGLKRVGALQAKVSEDELDSLAGDPNIDYVEENKKVYLLGNTGGVGEMESYGLTSIRGGKSQLDESFKRHGSIGVVEGATSLNPCDEGSGAVRVALVDSGVDASHPDLSCVENVNCIGKSFGSGTPAWNLPDDDHGTAAAGIVGAMRGNGLGVAGVVDGRTVCWIVARVFKSTGSNAYMDAVLNGIEWAVEVGKPHVINLSLGGQQQSTTEELFYDDIYKNTGAVIVAAAGNNGETNYFYPASYDSVVSVTSVDGSNKYSFFSQHNDAVDLVAPGESVVTTSRKAVSNNVRFLSTVVADGDSSSSEAVAARANHMSRSFVPPDAGLQGILVDCGNGNAVCSGPQGGHFCLIQRSSVYFYQQAQNCLDGGGVAAIIYNDSDGPLNAEIEAGNQARIPTLGISKADGGMFRQRVGEVVTLSTEPGYAAVFGTSFAAPHVTGAAAAVLQVCPACTNTQVVRCLKDGALDLGTSGRDDYYGHGLVQVDGTYRCLLNQEKCCDGDGGASSNQPGNGGGGGGGPVPSPTPAPTNPPAPSPPSNNNNNNDNSNNNNGKPDCASKLAAARKCLDNSAEPLACRSCTNGQIPPAGASCGQVETQMCFAFETCPCEACLVEIVDYFTCSYRTDQGCPFGCADEFAGVGASAMSFPTPGKTVSAVEVLDDAPPEDEETTGGAGGGSLRAAAPASSAGAVAASGVLSGAAATAAVAALLLA